MTRASGLITLAASCLFIYVNFGGWQAAAACVAGLLLLVLFYRKLKKDPRETAE